MNNFFRALIAGYGAKKLGGGCFGTIIVFILIWVALGQCSLNMKPSASEKTITIPLPEATIEEQEEDIIMCIAQ